MALPIIRTKDRVELSRKQIETALKCYIETTTGRKVEKLKLICDSEDSAGDNVDCIAELSDQDTCSLEYRDPANWPG